MDNVLVSDAVIVVAIANVPPKPTELSAVVVKPFHVLILADSSAAILAS